LAKIKISTGACEKEVLIPEITLGEEEVYLTLSLLHKEELLVTSSTTNKVFSFLVEDLKRQDPSIKIAAPPKGEFQLISREIFNYLTESPAGKSAVYSPLLSI